MQGKFKKLGELGQSIWLDDIHRSFIESGELKKWVEKGLRGETSNPSIFEKAIGESTEYNDSLDLLFQRQLSPKEIYESLIIEDITEAAKVFRPVYEATHGQDGFISVEVDPHFAHNTAATLAEARRLFESIDQPNLMVKVPATEEGIPAIRELTAEGRNINITLMFSLDQYDVVAEAYLSGLEQFAENGGDVSQVASVASFFVSRMDILVDPLLVEKGVQDLQGKIGIANAKMAYQRFRDTFSGERWEKLVEKGARPQRVLWASTSVKDPDYPDTMYVDALIGPHTINTLPLKTIQAFLDHGTVSLTVEKDLDKAQAQLRQLAELGIQMDEITEQLLVEGVRKFANSFDALMDTIAEKRNRALSGWEQMEAHMEDYQHALKRALEELAADRIVERMWNRDHTIWKPHPEEITNRLGWLDIAQRMQSQIPQMVALLDSVRAHGMKKVLFLGMGGASRAADLFARILHNPEKGFMLEVLDSIHPDAVSAARQSYDPTETLFVVSDKSGTTIETISLFKYFYNETLIAVGEALSGTHFVAITDPNTPLAELAKEFKFLATFLNDPNIGGRYSALSYDGLVPAALSGADLSALLERAVRASSVSPNPLKPSDNPGTVLGLILAELALSGRDKLTFVTPNKLEPFTDWVEQLVAASLGKEGKGILPVIHEPIRTVDSYGSDSFFVYFRTEANNALEEFSEFLEEAGLPVIKLFLEDDYAVGEHLYLWMMAIAIAGWRLGLNPFDQPNVERSEAETRNTLKAFQNRQTLLDYPPIIFEDNLSIFASAHANSIAEAIENFLSNRNDGHRKDGAPMPNSEQPYIALQAYLQPTEQTTIALQWLRSRLIEHTGLSTTASYAPRFLHGTGQLHKGDSGNGLFIQLTDNPLQDIPIPKRAGVSQSDLSFGQLCGAQAIGDRKALSANDRRVMRVHLHGPPAKAINRLAEHIQKEQKEPII